jgi:hypothetical protein
MITYSKLHKFFQHNKNKIKPFIHSKKMFLRDSHFSDDQIINIIDIIRIKDFTRGN